MPFEFEKVRLTLNDLPNQHEATWVKHRLAWIADLFAITTVHIEEGTLESYEAETVHLRILEQYAHTRDWGYSDETRQRVLDIATDFVLETALADDIVTKNWQTIQA